jgi:hypothetical protein
VRLWSLALGAEVLALHGHKTIVWDVAFSPDGRLASADASGTVKVWDARAPTPAVRTEREAVGLLNFLFARPLLKADVLAAVRADTAVSDAVRRKALELAGFYRDDPTRFNDASWAVVRRADASPEECRQALGWAETACRLRPADGNLLNTLGVAQYRVGQYKQALETLTRSGEQNTAKYRVSLPADLAFLAMAQHHRGQKDKARASLDGLRRALREHPRLRDAEAESFLREAETLIEGR